MKKERSLGKARLANEGGAVPVSPNESHLLEIFQYFLNVPDSMIEKLLMIYTFLTPEQITTAVEEHQHDKEARKGQRLLAKTLITQLTNSELKADQIGNYSHYFELNLQELVSSPGVGE
jgi:tyrosyl-tRNA synthetase